LKNLKYKVLICFVCFTFSTVKSQNEINYAEYTYVVKPELFNAQQNLKIAAIFDSIVYGKYTDAKTSIYQLKSKYRNDRAFYAALLTYEANIYYNESKYQYSIQLCDSVLNITQNKAIKGYYLKALNAKAKAQAALNNLSDAKINLQKAIDTANAHKDFYALSVSYYLMGSVYGDQGNYTTANLYHKASLALKELKNDLVGSAACYSFIGLNYAHLADYSTGITMLQKSISIREKINDKRGLANSYLCLYSIYYEMGDKDKALQSEFKSLGICQELNDLQCVSGRLTHIGELFQDKKDYTQALEYHFKALEISKKINIANRVALVHQNIAKVYLHTLNYSLATAHIDSSITINTSIGILDGLISAELTKAEILIKQNNTNQALTLAKSALAKSEKLKLPFYTKQAHEISSIIYSSLNQHQLSLYHYKQFVSLRDSINNIEKAKEITKKEVEFEYLKKEEITKLQQQKEVDEIQQQRDQQKKLTTLSIVILIIVSVFLIITIRLMKLKTASQHNLAKAYNVLSDKNEELNSKNETIEQQNKIIQFKNKEITDSIKYAYNIQSAIMPNTDEFKNYFKDAFVFFKPKDIISGDFYWVTKKDYKIIYVTADCTGHGVPGGFMSMLGVSFISEIINEHDLTEPALILSRLRKKVINALKQKGLSGENQDGMDMTICVFDNSTYELTFAAANRFLFIIRDGNLMQLNGDKQPVGIFGKEIKPFTQQTIQLQVNDLIITLTDGLADQFGGEKGKKYMYRRLKEQLISNSHLPLNEQEILIANSFNNWKGDLEQVDDVTIIGIRV